MATLLFSFFTLKTKTGLPLWTASQNFWVAWALPLMIIYPVGILRSSFSSRSFKSSLMIHTLPAGWGMPVAVDKIMYQNRDNRIIVK